MRNMTTLLANPFITDEVEAAKFMAYADDIDAVYAVAKRAGDDKGIAGIAAHQIITGAMGTDWVYPVAVKDMLRSVVNHASKR